MDLTRGDVVVAALPGDFGKPRPALVIQSDLFLPHPSITVLPFSSTRIVAPLVRIDVAPTRGNGLRAPSRIMVDKIGSLGISRLGGVIGRLEPETMVAVDAALALFLGIAR